VTIAGPNALILLVAGSYLFAAALCVTLPSAKPLPAEQRSPLQSVVAAEQAVGSTFSQLREGLGYIRAHRNISWSLVYLGITASLIGVLGVLGPDFATEALGLQPKDFVVVVLPLGFGIVTGILVLNAYGRLAPRRRIIETGLLAFGVLLMILSIVRRLVEFLQGVSAPPTPIDLSVLVSLLSMVIGIAFLAGVSYAVVAIPAQTQLQEDLPEEVRGRVFGVLNMLVSVASFLPIIIVGPISDFFGTSPVIFAVGLMVAISGFASIVLRGPLRPAEAAPHVLPGSRPSGATTAVDPLGIALHPDVPGAAAEGPDAAGQMPAPAPVTGPREGSAPDGAASTPGRPELG
jgi:DHA3 family macrolide efflux protein-like MFS transporter